MESQDMNFEWLANLSKWQCFTTCELSRPAKSLDFGSDGFTASLTDWHEILQITRPDSTCGVVFLRGRFPDNASSILSRAQRRDSEGTFGTKILPPRPGSHDVELGERKAQGWVNFRWPYTQYELIHREPDTSGPLVAGTCESVSFVHNGTVYQVHRLKWGHGSSVSNYSSDLAQNTTMTARLRIGGIARFGCPCSSSELRSNVDTFTIQQHTRPTDFDGHGLSCTSTKYNTRLEHDVFVHGSPYRGTARVCRAGTQFEGRTVDLSDEFTVLLPPGESVYVVSRYALRNEEEDPASASSATMPSSDELQDYLGVSRESVHMTDRLWTALCATNYEAIEAVEFCIVGRTVEQILSVTSVPVRRPKGPLPGYEDPGLPQTALIGNIMTYQYVDVQSAFFQIRLLAKIHHFIQTRKLEPDLFQPHCSLDAIREVYLVKLREAIRSAITWLFETDLKQGHLLLAIHSEPGDVDSEGDPVDPANALRLQTCVPQRESLYWDRSYNRGCFATIAAWHVFRVCPEAVTRGFIDETVLPNLPVAYSAGIDRADREKQPTSKSNVLQWLHFSCLLLLYDELGWDENALPEGVNRDDLRLSQIAETQEQFEKYVSRLKTSSADGWSVEHEELDRVLLLAEELGLDRLKSKKSYGLAVSRVRQTRKRIQERRRTTKFNTGPKQWMTARSLSNGPWELLCTNHEAYLRVASDADVIPARDRLFEFLLSDYSFMSSWDRADAKMIPRWWDIYPMATICSTLLDLKVEGKLQAAKSIDPTVGDPSVDESMEQSVPNLRADTVLRDISAAAGRSTDNAQTALIQALVQQLRQITEESARSHAFEDRTESVKAFDWVTQRPSAVYYPDWWVQSLDDTPDIFHPTQTRDVRLRRSLQHFLECHGAEELTENPGYTISNVVTRIPQGDLSLLDVFDVYQDGGFDFYTKRRRCAPTAPAGVAAALAAPGSHTSPGASGRERADEPLYSHLELLATLNDSLVDVAAKHRILFARKVSPALVGGLVYLWHPDAIDAVDDHFGSTSRFVESREKSLWTTRITISHWAIRTCEEHRTDRYREIHRQHGDFPPENIAKLGFESDTMHMVEEQSSTVVFTGDSSGYLWICSILSSATQSDSIARVVNKVLPKILEKFIHQQASARCLAFLLILGHLCEKLAAEYGEVLARLDDIMEIGDRTLLEGLEDWWGTVEAVNKLKKMLWGWEALRVFNDKLSSSLTQIQRAQMALEHEIKHDAVQQHIDLITEYNGVVEEFKKRQGMLVDIHDKTQLKIKQVTGLRDGISTITNVVDTQTALADNQTTIQQGNNIRTLTYITIAYLPLGFITGLFSIQHATFMDQATNWQFALLIVLFSLGTYLLAFTLDRALVQFKGRIWPDVLTRNRSRVKRKKDVEAIPLETWPRKRSGS